MRQTILMTGAAIMAALACASAILPILQQRVRYLGTIDRAWVAWPVGLLSAVGVTAGYLTAWRATHVDAARRSTPNEVR